MAVILKNIWKIENDNSYIRERRGTEYASSCEYLVQNSMHDVGINKA